jgi:hypothetical protein
MLVTASQKNTATDTLGGRASVAIPGRSADAAGADFRRGAQRIVRDAGYSRFAWYDSQFGAEEMIHAFVIKSLARKLVGIALSHSAHSQGALNRA